MLSKKREAIGQTKRAKQVKRSGAIGQAKRAKQHVKQ
jgi:hypothetical protein